MRSILSHPAPTDRDQPRSPASAAPHTVAASQPPAKAAAVNEQHAAAGLLVRLMLWTAVLFGIGQILQWGANAIGPEIVMSETGLMELVQETTLAVSIILLLIAARWTRAPHRAATWIAAIVVMVFFIREMDSLLAPLEPWLGWEVLAGAAIATAVILAVWHRDTIAKSVADLVLQRSFLLWWAGCAVAFYAQQLGHGPLIEPLFGDDYITSLKRVIEEGLELLGYILILAGTIEHMITHRPRRDNQPPPPPAR